MTQAKRSSRSGTLSSRPARGSETPNGVAEHLTCDLVESLNLLFRDSSKAFDEHGVRRELRYKRPSGRRRQRTQLPEIVTFTEVEEHVHLAPRPLYESGASLD